MGRLFISLGEWFRILPNVFIDCPVFPVRILQNLFFFSTWGNRWCAPPVVFYVVMADDSIYEGISIVGNLTTSALIGQVSSFAT